MSASQTERIPSLNYRITVYLLIASISRLHLPGYHFLHLNIIIFAEYADVMIFRIVLMPRYGSLAVIVNTSTIPWPINTHRIRYSSTSVQRRLDIADGRRLSHTAGGDRKAVASTFTAQHSDSKFTRRRHRKGDFQLHRIAGGSDSIAG